MNWFKRSKTNSSSVPGLADSILYDENTFYHGFYRDLLEAVEEVIIDSPFITLGRLKTLQPVFEKLIRKNIKVFVVTKPPRSRMSR